MCIFFTASGELVVGRTPEVRAVRVANTRIFARLTSARSQLLVYEMSFGSAQDAAMVLPLPVAADARENAVRFIDFSRHARFFDRLAELFDDGIAGLALDGPAAAPPPSRPPLPVHEVGAYEASYVPSVGDFDRLDARFAIPAGLWDAHPKYCAYGFAVFRLRPTGGALKGVHPMALEFDTSLARELFIPTVHVHDGTLHAKASFDHQIYIQGSRGRLEPPWEQVGEGLVMRKGPAYLIGPSWSGSKGWEWIEALSADDRAAAAAAKWSPRDWSENAGPAPSPEMVRRGQEVLSRATGLARKLWPVAECAPWLDPFENLDAVEMLGEFPNRDTFFAVEPVAFRALA